MRITVILLGVTLVAAGLSHRPADAVATAYPASRPAAAPAFLGMLQQTGLNITVPGTRSYGAAPVGASISGPLGPVTVRDFRGPVNPNSWVVTVTSTAYTTGAAGPSQTIANSRVSYWSGPATRSTGGGTLVPGQPTSAQAVVLSAPRIAFRKTTGNGNNRVTWNPTVIIAVPTGVTGGTYTGRITHSVA
ncbi:hypothetical protein O7632_30510 [Solwaraspora sp. WMMD406]|uniref:hypothetical protein n=1 Tax=Solwaraspora sp. WMMD406 TaxID=3016095 RepID=UPI002416203F|nr:hypothetical protein [Solwaraspora sp. WMMD406]MDG4768393.1 hypothetical protein [Solwaraspora sp. WMMD406]